MDREMRDLKKQLEAEHHLGKDADLITGNTLSELRASAAKLATAKKSDSAPTGSYGVLAQAETPERKW